MHITKKNLNGELGFKLLTIIPEVKEYILALLTMVPLSILLMKKLLKKFQVWKILKFFIFSYL